MDNFVLISSGFMNAYSFWEHETNSAWFLILWVTSTGRLSKLHMFLGLRTILWLQRRRKHDHMAVLDYTEDVITTEGFISSCKLVLVVSTLYLVVDAFPCFSLPQNNDLWSCIGRNS